LAFGGQLLPRPGGVGSSILERHMHRRFLLAPFERTGGTVRMAPVRAGYIGPSTLDVAHIRTPGRHKEHCRAGFEQVRLGSRIKLWVERALGDGEIARCLDKGGEFSIGDSVGVHPKTAYRHCMRWRL